jgi:HAD superfamily hydrolase (TIGR01509 family)
MRRAFIFDFDGTLVDSERHYQNIIPRVFGALSDAQWTEEDQKKMVGVSAPEGHRIFVEDYGIDVTFARYVELLEHHAEDFYRHRIGLMPGALACIERLRKSGMSLAIASSNREPFIRLALERLDIQDCFSAISASDDVPIDKAKPAPDLYLLAAKRLGVAPRECVAIEDSIPGITSAKTAGMFCIAMRTEFNQGIDLTKADVELTSFDDLDPVAVAWLGLR